MNLIERYIFRKAGVASLVILGSLSGVVWIVQALREIDVVTANGQTIMTFLSLTTLAVPNLVLAIIPVALLLSTLYTINTMNTNSELVVVSASGMSNWRISKPLIVLALICSLFSGLMGHVLSPLSLLKLKDFVTEMRADLVSLIIREGTFNTIEDGLTFHVAKRGAGGILYGVLISDDREDDVSVIYSANEGIVTRNNEGSFLKLKDGEIQQTNREDGSVTLVKYQSYIFDLSSFSGNIIVKPVKAKERTTLELLNPDPNDPVFKSNPGRYRSQLHERFSEMLWPFAYVFVILAFAGQARSSRQSFATSITAATVSVIIARGFAFSAVSALKTDTTAVIYVYALPIGCILFGAYCVFNNKPATLPKSVIRHIDRQNEKIIAAFQELQTRYKAYQRRRAGVET
ncbi:MAG: LptF/LptG family permease [Pseudomonadota bacterium]